MSFSFFFFEIKFQAVDYGTFYTFEFALPILEKESILFEMYKNRDSFYTMNLFASLLSSFWALYIRGHDYISGPTEMQKPF